MNSLSLDPAPVFELNPAQRQAVDRLEGVSLILAGAGTGKTHTLICKVVAALESGVSPGSVMLLTFTNKAASEMTRRAESYTRRFLKGMHAGTFHSVGARLLRRHGERIGVSPDYTILDTEDSKTLFRHIHKEMELGKSAEFPRPAAVQPLYSFLRNTGADLSRLLSQRYPGWVEYENKLAKVFRRYEDMKKQGNTLDFDDLLEGFLALLKNGETGRAIRERFTWIFVDEFQDTNRIQNEIVRGLSRSARSLTVVGDDAQSIYAFRGACFRNIMDFPGQFRDTAVFRLETNYRSTSRILEFANDVIRNNLSQFKKNLVPAEPLEGARPRIFRFHSDTEQSLSFSEMIRQKKRAGVPCSEIAVLYRSHSHSLTLQMTLGREGIPFKIFSGLRFFEQAHVKDILAFLKVLYNPRDAASWKRLLLMVPAAGQKTASKILSRIADGGPAEKDGVLSRVHANLSAKSRNAWKTAFEFLSEAGADREKPSELIDRLLLVPFFSAHLERSYDNAELREDDLRQLAVFSEGFPDLDAFLSEVVLMTTADEQRNAGDVEAVTLTTVHQAKGLEWNTVLILWMAEGYFPSYRSFNSREQMEEERRLFYVAATRAKRDLVIGFPAVDRKSRQGQFWVKPSRFLTEIDEELFRFHDLGSESL